MKKYILLLVITALSAGACKKDNTLEKNVVNITDYIALFKYGIYAGPEYPMYGVFVFGANNNAQMIINHKLSRSNPSYENVAYILEGNKLKFPTLKSEIEIKEGATTGSDYYFDPADENPGGAFANVFIMKKPAENMLKGKTFGGMATGSDGSTFELYYKFDNEMDIDTYKYARANMLAHVNNPQINKHHCDFFGNVAFVKDTNGVLEEAGVLKDGKLQVLMYDRSDHTWNYASLSEINE